MSDSLDEFAETRLQKCPTCRQYQCDCNARSEPVGVKRSDDLLEITLPPQPASPELKRAVVAEVDGMIREAGGDPDDWVIVSFGVNKWQAQPGKQQEPIWLHQVKATCRLATPAEETEWWRLVESIRTVVEARPKPPRVPKRVRGASRLVVCMGDDQAPHVNQPLHEATCAALAAMKPDSLVYMGDGIDLSNMGQWAAKKLGTRFEADINPSLQSLNRILTERVTASGATDLHYLYGNHEARLLKELQTKIPQLVGLRQAPDNVDILDIAYLAGLDRLGFTVARDPAGDYPHGTVIITPGLLASHGWIVRKGSGASAQGSIEHLEASLLVGHTHRLAVSHVTRWRPTGPVIYTAGETGTMADLGGLGYSRNPDWQGGFLVVVVDDSGFNVEPVVWRDGSLRWRDERWGT